MALLDVLLNEYLSTEDVQQLARDRGLPTGRTKGDLIALLLSRNLDPEEPLAFLNVTALRDLCREFGLDRTGDRGALIARLRGAIRTESSSWRSSFHPDPLPQGAEQLPSESRTIHQSESAGPWTVAGVVATAIVAGVLLLGVDAFGTIWGIVISLVTAVVIAAVLLLTSPKWHPRVSALIRRAG